VRAGELNRRVIIEQATRSRNTFNEEVLVWTAWATVWAALEPATGRTYYAAKQYDAKVDGRVRIRYIEGLRSDMRLNYNGRILSIVGIIHPKEDRKEIQIIYSEALD